MDKRYKIPGSLKILFGLVPVALVIGLQGCSTGPAIVQDSYPPQPVDVSQVPDAIPKQEPPSRYGNPPSYEVFGKRYHVMQSSQGYVARGIASWYGTKFHGRRTSSGEPYNMYAMTAAHTSLPLPTYAQVTNLRNGRSVVVKINDRGPFHDNRIIDLSYAAASKLDILNQGTGLVEVKAITPGQASSPTRITAQPASELFIQIGAFISRDNAERLATKLSGTLQGSIRVQTATQGANPIYRVQVGPLSDVLQADNMSIKLAQLGIDKMHIVID